MPILFFAFPKVKPSTNPLPLLLFIYHPSFGPQDLGGEENLKNTKPNRVPFDPFILVMRRQDLQSIQKLFSFFPKFAKRSTAQFSGKIHFIRIKKVLSFPTNLLNSYAQKKSKRI